MVLRPSGSSIEDNSIESSDIKDGTIVNVDINASAGITYSKMESLSANKAVITNSNGIITTSTVTSTELSYVSGATSAIQSQIDGKLGTGGGTVTGAITISPANVSGVQSGIVLKDNGSGSSEGLIISWRNSDTGNTDFARVAGLSSTSGNGGHLIFYTNSTSSGTIAERMRITKDGYVGIGLTAPTYKLHVNGDMRLGSTDFNVDEDVARYITSGGQLYLQSNDSSTGNSSWVGAVIVAGNLSDATNTRIDVAGSKTDGNYRFIDFYTNNTRRFKIDENGKVGIGTTNMTHQLNVNGVVAPSTDNQRTLGAGGLRWSELFCGNGSINTSDQNEKTEIEFLEEVELRVASRLKGLVKKFKMKDAVALKGDNARIHIGVIAQDVAKCFTDEGLNPDHYSLFCRDVWYEKQVTETVLKQAPNPLYDASKDNDSNNPKTVEIEETVTYTKILDSQEENAIRRERLGIRYEQLLAFLISVL